MVVAESFVVGTIPGLVDVQQRHDKTRPAVVTPNTAARLDVLGVGLGLPHDDHQSQARNVEPHRDHVRGESAVHPVLDVVEIRLETSLGGSDLVRADTGREFDDLIPGSTVLERPLNLA